MRRRTSASPICDSSRRLAHIGRTPSSSPAISGGESFNSPFRAWHSASTYADAAGTFASITGLRTRFACRRIVCCDPKCPDADGNTEERGDTISVFNGPAPDIRTLTTQEDEVATVGKWISTRVKEGARVRCLRPLRRRIGSCSCCREEVGAPIQDSR
jgi:hypothetical protein